MTRQNIPSFLFDLDIWTTERDEEREREREDDTIYIYAESPVSQSLLQETAASGNYYARVAVASHDYTCGDFDFGAAQTRWVGMILMVDGRGRQGGVPPRVRMRF